MSTIVAVRTEVKGGYALSDGGLPGVYRIAYMDLHWGGEDTRGSEHTMDGKAYAMEVCEHEHCLNLV